MGRRVALAACVLTMALLPARAPAGTMVDELPNLVPLPAFDLELDTLEEKRILLFAVSTANRGEYALDLQFEAEGASTQTASADQCVEWATDRVCSARKRVGSFEWHPDHGHHHFQDFALYEIRRFRRPGVPDMRPKGLVATSGKVSFCVMDVEQDRSPDAPIYDFAHPLYYGCAVGAGFQGISPGWRDVYSTGTPGQWFDLAYLTDGSYALVVTSDPAARLFETDETDNRAVVGFTLSDETTQIDPLCTSSPGELRCTP